MIIPVLTAGKFLVKTGIGRHIHLTADDRIDSRFPGCSVKINHAIHHAMIRNRRAVHAQFFHPFYVFFDFIGSVQQGVLRMNVQMCKCHIYSPFS